MMSNVVSCVHRFSIHDLLKGRNMDGNVELLRNWRIVSSVVHCGRCGRQGSCFAPKVGQWLVCLSLACPPRTIPYLTRNFSGFSCCDASGCRFVPLTVTAGVACHSTLVATTEQLARHGGSWDDGVSLWKVLLPVSAGMPAQGCLRT